MREADGFDEHQVAGIPGPVIRNDYWEWFIARAETFLNIDEKLSKNLARHAKMKQCYKNCATKAYGDLKYYDGFVKIPDSPIWIEHAFLVRDGMVVDPTLGIRNVLRGTIYVGIFHEHPMDTLMRLGRFESITQLKFMEHFQNQCAR